MSCSRCQGLMVAENLFTPSEGLSHTWVPVTRCLNCGNLEDSLIRLARRLPEQLQRSVRPGPRRRGIWIHTLWRPERD
jgi:hypothetical protein